MMNVNVGDRRGILEWCRAKRVRMEACGGWGKEETRQKVVSQFRAVESSEAGMKGARQVSG